MMTIKHEKMANSVRVIVSGLIKTIDDSANFKNSVYDAMEKYGKTPIEIHVQDSFIVTSSIIGTLLKMVKKDEVDISLIAYKDELYDLLSKLGLAELLKLGKA